MDTNVKALVIWRCSVFIRSGTTAG